MNFANAFCAGVYGFFVVSGFCAAAILGIGLVGIIANAIMKLCGKEDEQ